MFGAGPTGLLLAQLIAGAARIGDRSRADASSSSTRAQARDRPDACSSTGTTRRPHGSAAGGLTGGDGYDYVVEATGSPGVGNICVPLTRNGGTVMVYGVTKDEELVRFHPFDVFRREITIKGSFAEMTCFAAAIARCAPGGSRPTASSPTGSPFRTTARRWTRSPAAAAHKVVILP